MLIFNLLRELISQYKRKPFSFERQMRTMCNPQMWWKILFLNAPHTNMVAVCSADLSLLFSFISQWITVLDVIHWYCVSRSASAVCWHTPGHTPPCDARCTLQIANWYPRVALDPHTVFGRHFYPKILTVHLRNTFEQNVSWESSPWRSRCKCSCMSCTFSTVHTFKKAK